MTRVAPGDQGLPQLTAVGAWRGHGLAVGPQLSGGPDPYGGYYTQSEVRELVAYAAGLGITIIPEIDIPGHCHAAIRRCPSCWWKRQTAPATSRCNISTTTCLTRPCPAPTGSWTP